MNEGVFKWCVPGATASPNAEEQLLQDTRVSRLQGFCVESQLKPRKIHQQTIFLLHLQFSQKTAEFGLEEECKNKETEADVR